MTQRAAITALTTALLLAFSAAGRVNSTPESDSGTFNSERASFTLRYKDESSPYRIAAAFVLPAEELILEAVPAGGDSTFTAQAAAGSLTPDGRLSWRWLAPDSTGVYPIIIRRVQPADSVTINVFVMVPLSQVEDGYLSGYQIGKYPAEPLRGLSIYRPPPGFIEVTPDNGHTLLAPHFRLEQFLCKQESGWPKYVVLRERLILKLEAILEELNRRGYQAHTLAVLSGYRTPYYNRAIGNVRYSRHVYGGAADIYVDEDPIDEMMDDLNQDDRIDYRDAAILYDIIDELYGRAWYAPFVGGLGRYRRTSNHGPFVHVDVRGFRARWGT